MGDGGSRERDLVLSPNEFAFIGDQTKGNINVYVGPYKTSLANTDQPVVFDDRTKRFVRTNLEEAIQVFAIAPEGWYCMLKNPADKNEFPKLGTVNSLSSLNVGRKVNLPGPIAFPLWPGQMSRVIQGHLLKSSQYLIVRVYDEQAARENWRKAVIKPQRGAEVEGDAPEVAPDLGMPDLTMGKLLIIRGTEVSFYIPPTGIEVVRDDSGNYIRDAVTLERLEYCILLDETGRKRFVRGAAVVFPEPTEQFVEKNGRRKFKAIELNEISGIYVKVIEGYTEDGTEFHTGDELFITGRDQMIYFPRPEHAIIKYGDQEIHYAVAIPAGEGRYVLDRISGQIELQQGPAMFLPDPRRQVIVRRLLEPEQVEAWFPGDRAARDYYARLRRMAGNEHDGFLMAEAAPRMAAKMAGLDEEVVDAFVGDDFNRNQTFTQPRTITLDTKYEGAVSIDVPTGYAVLVVSKTGTRRVVIGPATCLLAYDESLEAMHLSTGTPKTDKTLLRTAYLRVLHNKVSDVVQAETRDLCRVSLQVSYRVNFDGDAEHWFQVENYVRFLSDHLRSLLRKAIKDQGIEEFYPNAIGFVRDTVLGAAGEDGSRPGRLFKENGMKIYDVEVLDVVIGDEEIARLLVEAQHTIVEKTLSLTAQRRHLDYVQQNEAIRRQIQGEESTTRQEAVKLQTVEVESQLNFNLAKVEAEAKAKRTALEARLTDQTVLDGIQGAELLRQKAAMDQELAVTKEKLMQRIEEIRAEVQAVVDKAEAVSPDLIAALQAFGDKALAEKMAETMAPLAILGGKSVADVMANLLAGTALEGVIREKFLPGLKAEKKPQ